MLYCFWKVIMLLLKKFSYHFKCYAESGLHWQQHEAVQGGQGTFSCATLFYSLDPQL